MNMHQCWVIALSALAVVPASHAADGIIRFQGAIVEPASCLPQLRAGEAPARVECDAERARAAGKPADRFRLSARHVSVQTRPVMIAPPIPGKAGSQGYEIILAYL